ncbi:SusC/RagA family TonB-linked outer membrane protein [Bacteroides clarus]|uniref:SusC/RagA family TonB-linked outer membrane protein n=1 Tax=Bacteroides clarus TaxID=626929 RepID=UPI0026658A5B|nr:SusC/RagA family TonB-linked outer membrane protein [Bacteroides clarus]
MNGEHKRSSADVMVTQTTLIKRLFILSVTGLMLMCGGCFSGMSVYAQNATSSNAQHAKKISGVVIDSNGEPIIGAAVLVQGTSVGVATDVDGKFSLDVPSNGKTLVVSYIGYDNQEVPITSSSQYKITLSGTNYALDEVVVTALGMKREKKALGYSVQDVKGDALIENRTANIATSLNGKVAGMNISATSIPGGSNRIVIRGNNSISGNNMPLVVVDGVPFDNTQGVDDATTNSWGTGFSDTGDGLSMLNPDDVESISVLKGPSATALYGSRGGNGVILVTTKKGQGGKTLVSYNSNFTFENVMIQPEFQNEYGQGTGGAFDITSRNSWGPKMGTVVTDWTGQTRPLEAKNNDFSDFMNTGTSWTNSVDVTGSAAKMNYRVGLSNTTRKGVIPNNSLSKNNFSVRAGGEIIKNLTLDAKVNYTYQKGKGRPEFSASGFNPIFALIYTPRSINLHEMKNIFDEEGNILDWYSKPLTVVNNPYAATSLSGNQDVTNRVNGFASLTYDINSWLKAMVRFGGDTYGKKTEKWIRHGLIVSSGYSDGRFSTGQYNMTEYNVDFLVTAQKDNIADSKFSGSLSVGGNKMNRKYNTFVATAEGLNIPELYTIQNGISQTTSTYNSQKEVQSLYALGQLSWDNYLFFDVTVRNDWSSTLPKNNRSFLYPSFSLGWAVTDMLTKFKVNVPEWISFGKLRASYAEAGNDTDPYQLLSVLSTVSNMAGGQMGVAEPSTKTNANLKPEIIKSMEFGADVRFFDNRLGFDVTYYDKRAYNQIISMPSSITSGYSAKYINAGRVDNWGWELQVNAVPVRTKDWDWNVWVNFAKNSSKIVELTEGVESITLAQPMGQNCYVRATVGEPYGQIYTNGFKYDDNGNRLVGDDGKYIVDNTLRVSGNMNPDWTAGIGSTLRWKNLSFGFLIDVRYGGDVYLQSMMRLQSNGQTKETVAGREEYYTTGKGLISQGVNVNTGLPNTVELDPTTYWGQFYGNIGNYIYDTTNVRLRELNLTWTLPDKWFAKTIIRGLKLSAVANNVCFLYNNLPGFDPECTYSTGNGQGIETASLPSTRSFGFNLNVTF